MDTPTVPHAVVVAPVAVKAFHAWVDAIGAELKPVPAGPGQMPRYNLIAALERKPAPLLSKRRFQILCHASRGLTNAQIGRHLHISEDSVKTHWRGVFKALGVNDRTHAVAVAYQIGLLPIGGEQ